MSQNNRSTCIVSLGLAAVLFFALAPAKAQSLPEGKGKAEFQRICSNCHSVTMATSQRMTQSEWEGVVNDMVSRGAQGTQDDLESVVAYLTANFGKGKPLTGGPAARETPAPAITQKAVPLSEAEITHGNELLRANDCLSCHRVGDAGAYLAPDLSDIGAHRLPQQIRASLVSPNKEVVPENRTVRLVTRDGKTVTGRLLNQDGFSVQIIDSSSQLRSFQKSDLREFTIVTTNPMPSYADKMRAQDVTDLVQYLSSLRGSVQP